MKKLVLHIGSHKTATTHLQNVLMQNAETLRRHGLLYPDAGQIYEAHHLLPWSLRETEYLQTPIDEIPVWQALFEEIDASECDTVLVSSEDFEWNPEIPRLAKLQERYQVQVVFFFRSPESYLESYYNQIVKDFSTRETRPIENYICEESLFFLDARHILARWAGIFGDEAISVRLFAKEHLKDGIEAALLGAIGCRRDIRLTPPGPSVLHKTSLPPDALEFLRLANPHLTEKDGHFQFVLDLAQKAQSRKELLQETSAGMLSLRAKQTILGRFAGRNTAVAQRFLGSDENPFPRDAAWEHPDFARRQPTGSAETLARVAALLLSR